MDTQSRRTFTRKMLQTVVSVSLLESLFQTHAIGKALGPITRHWAIELHEYCADLRKEALGLIEWQDQIEKLFDRVELEEVLRFIDFNRLIKGFNFPDLGVDTRMVRFPKMEGLPERTAFVKKIFGLKKDRAIIPHGHSNMSSAHLLLQGEMHLRHYDKIRQEKDHLIISPTIDTVIVPGESSSISDERDNVHWFVANTASAFTFDVIMLDLAEQSYDIHNLDIYEQEKLGDGMLRVPMLEVEAALKKYGKESHH